MPYLQVDLDAMHRWPMVAAGCGVTEAQVYKGMLKLWESRWREGSGYVSMLFLECIFEMPGRGERCVEVLKAFGFLEVREDGYWVCGSERYLRIKEARSKGGKKASGNLKRGKSPGSSRRAAGKQPESTPGSGPALTPNTEHHSPSSTDHAGEKPPAAEASESGYQQLVDGLFAAFRADRGKDPEPTGRDWKALKRLRERTKQGDREILLRWARGLRAEFKQRVDSFHDLDAKWDALASGDPPKRAGGARFFAAQDADPAAFAKTGTVDDF